MPEVVISDEEVGSIARGQFIRPKSPDSVPRAAAEAPGPIRVRDRAGHLVAIATLSDGRLAPDKVLVESPTASSGATADA
jgi:hypothetical protein